MLGWGTFFHCPRCGTGKPVLREPPGVPFNPFPVCPKCNDRRIVSWYCFAVAGLLSFLALRWVIRVQNERGPAFVLCTATLFFLSTALVRLIHRYHDRYREKPDVVDGPPDRRKAYERWTRTLLNRSGFFALVTLLISFVFAVFLANAFPVGTRRHLFKWLVWGWMMGMSLAAHFGVMGAVRSGWRSYGCLGLGAFVLLLLLILLASVSPSGPM